MKTLEGTKTKIDRQIRTFVPVLADSSQALPTEIEILQVGMWETPYHGMFMITEEDLQQYKENFDAGIAQPSVGFGLPIDFAHQDHLEAAGWIKKLEIRGVSLFGKVEWTTAGSEALKGGLYKCFSPMFYPRTYGGWEDPEQVGLYVENVLAGGGLTNIPLFKGLTPVMASAASSDKLGASEKKNIIYVSASESKNKELQMNLEELRKKDTTTLTTEERAFLSEKKAELTPEENKALGFEETPAPTDAPAADAPAPEATPAAAEDADAASVAADIKSGKMVAVSASRLKNLEETASQYQTEKAQAIVDEHIGRGAIVADQRDLWVNELMTANGEARTQKETMLKNLPSNQAVAASAKGAETSQTPASASAELEEKAEKAVAASNGSLNYGAAVKQVLASDKDLNTRVNQERSGQDN